MPTARAHYAVTLRNILPTQTHMCARRHVDQQANAQRMAFLIAREHLICSTGTTESSPVGKLAPVMISHASPFDAATPSPAACEPTTANSPPENSVALPLASANPSIALLSKGGKFAWAYTSCAKTRPSDCARGTSSIGKGLQAARTCWSASL
ncbi:MAG: hypothetical protein M3Q51_08750 [Pseudomonadota bacterium]|nr:hypothetical protein [Pseudomonadota bacterium]